MTKRIFVFGSNEAGIHGAGAANVAMREHGAVYGCGYGHVGNSFAIPTKDLYINTLMYRDIYEYVKGFIQYANGRSDLTFQVTRIGCGLAGLKDETMADMFTYAPKNCLFDSKWEMHMPEGFNYWGTF